MMKIRRILCLILCLAMTAAPAAVFGAEKEMPEIRVLLQRWGLTDRLDVRTQETYLVRGGNGTELLLPQKAEAVFLLRAGKIILFYQGLSVSLGNRAELLHRGDGKESGFRTGAKSELYTGDLALTIQDGALRGMLRIGLEDYVRGVIELSLPADVVRRIGMPNTDSVAIRARAATGGTLLAARLALEGGIACNTAGGSHHACAESGAGFCVFNDVAVAARRLLAEGRIGQALVVDLDVHQGDGTARIFENDPSVFTFSMHAEKNFPHRKAVSDLDVELADATGDAEYLAKLADVLPALLSSVRPDIVFFNAGVDPHADDKLGRLSLTDAGLERREAYVLGACLDREIPVVGVIGGGYDADIDRLAARHAILHRTAKSLYA